MGNSHSGLRLQSNEDYSYHVQMGKSASIDLPEVRKVYIGQKEVDKEWTAKYTVDGRTCALRYTQRVDVSSTDHLSFVSLDASDGPCSGEKLSISIEDDVTESCDKGGFQLVVQRSKDGHLKLIGEEYATPTLVLFKTKKTTDAKGGITDTVVYSYGVKRRGLIVTERKRKSESDRTFYMITVAHYFVVAPQVFSHDKIDIGLSVVIRLRGDKSNGSGYTVAGPVQHPAAALLNLFDHVLRSVSWTPTACPHCASAKNGGRTKFAFGSFLRNDGVNKGNGNGSVYVDKVVVGR